MNDQQLKIRIKLNQLPPLLATENSEETVNQAKPPFDWQKISAAALLLIGIVGGGLYGWLAEENSPPGLAALAPDDPRSLPHDNLTLEEETGTNEIPSIGGENIAEFSAATATTNPVINPLPQPPGEEKANLRKSIIPAKKPEIADINTLHHTSKAQQVFTDRSHVIKAQLTSAIREQEPIDSIDHVLLAQEASQPIHFFLHLRGLHGKKATISWYYQDKEVVKIPLLISNDDWRTTSTHTFNKNQLGEWRVEIQDQAGKLLAGRIFTVDHHSK